MLGVSKNGVLLHPQWDGSSVGLERMLDRHEVTSSILVRPTKRRKCCVSFQWRRDVSPVGLERCLHTAEVTGSSPVRPTNNKDNPLIFSGFFFFSSVYPPPHFTSRHYLKRWYYVWIKHVEFRIVKLKKSRLTSLFSSKKWSNSLPPWSGLRRFAESIISTEL